MRCTDVNSVSWDPQLSQVSAICLKLLGFIDRVTGRAHDVLVHTLRVFDESSTNVADTLSSSISTLLRLGATVRTVSEGRTCQ